MICSHPVIERNRLKIFGIEIRRTKSPAALSSAQTERPAMGQGPFTAIFEQWIMRKVQPALYEALRESIPIIDVALHRLVSLDGILRFDGPNKGLVNEITDWAHAVQVNDMQRGLQSFVNNLSNETYEQGFSISEFVASPNRDDIIRLNVADSKDIFFRRADNSLEIWYRGRSYPRKNINSIELVGDILQDNLIGAELHNRMASIGYAPLNPGNLIYYSIDNENHNPYGTSMLRSTEFVSKILLTIQNATLNSWERFGDPSYHVEYKTSKRDLGADTLEARRKKISDDFTSAVSSKRSGKSADFITALDKDSEISITVIGADGHVLQMQEPARHALEQLTARFHMPPWLLGFHWSTTERLAQYESEILLQEAEIRSENKLPSIKRLIETMLRMRGRKWKNGDWEVYFELPNLHDLVAQAQARFLNAQADMYYGQLGLKDQIVGSSSTNDPSLTAKRARKTKTFTTELNCKCEKSTKESRPVAFPELDKVETDYLAAITGRWAALKNRFLTILKLQPPGKAAGKGPDALPGANTFTFSDEQRAQVYQAMKDWIGEWKPGADNEKALEWYYGQSYSLGLIQAAHMLGNDRPVLDIIANSEIYQELVDNGFMLLKNNATQVIVNRLLPEMQAQVLAGTNPLHVANRLAGIFDDANSNWERLARSEMSMAAERAKIDEAKANNIGKMEFVVAPDACSICQSLAGEYEIDQVPVPVRDTHPRCYCTTAAIA